RTLPEGTPIDPTAEELSARFAELRQLARIERCTPPAFFLDPAASTTPSSTCAAAPARTSRSPETPFGRCLRDAKGDLARFVYVPSYRGRLLPFAREAVEMARRVRVPQARDT